MKIVKRIKTIGQKVKASMDMWITIQGWKDEVSLEGSLGDLNLHLGLR
jgi:hypothetical protein